MSIPTPFDSPVHLPVDPTDWEQVSTSDGHVYGHSGNGESRSNLLLETTGQGVLYAVRSGVLTARPPGYDSIPKAQDLLNNFDWEYADSDQLDAMFNDPLVGQQLPETIDLYLHFQSPVQPQMPSAGLFEWEAWTNQLPTVNAFVYKNVDTASLPTHLSDFLDNPEFIGDPPQLADYESDLTSEKRAELLVGGLLEIKVEAGAVVGEAGSPEPLGKSGTSTFAGLAPITKHGPTDPFTFYGAIGMAVPPGGDSPTEAAASDFVNHIDTEWPLYDVDDRDNALGQTTERTFPMAALHHMKMFHGLSPSEWRTVGDNQKAVYKDHLAKRTSDSSEDIPVFEFDLLDARNVFQLEAVAEFYANYHEPWGVDTEPRNPDLTIEGTGATIEDSGDWWTEVNLDGASDLDELKPNMDLVYFADDESRDSGTYRIVEINEAENVVKVMGDVDFGESDDGTPTSDWAVDYYVTASLLDPAGEAATVEEDEVTLDDAEGWDLRWLWLQDEGYLNGDDAMTDTLLLDEKPDEVYEITGVDPANDTLTVNGNITESGTELTSAWRIRRRPRLVLVDPLGGRVDGTTATVSDDGDNVLELSGPEPVLTRVNSNFDTIALPDESGDGEYRITWTSADESRVSDNDGEGDGNGGNDTPMVTLHEDCSLGNDSSRWQIMSGLGCRLPPLYYVMGSESEGHDHFDGVLFLVFDGEVQRYFRWSTYTGRDDHDNPQDPSRSSIRGNNRFEVLSFQATTSESQNYNMRIVDELAKYHDGWYDDVREAGWYFFDNPPDSEDDVDTTEAVPADRTGSDVEHVRNSTSNSNGKEAIRFHWGPHYREGDSAKSAGCVTSPAYPGLRSELVARYLEEYEAVHGSTNETVERLLGLNHQESQNLYDDDIWANKIGAILWLLRPDQRPTEEV
ncbi:MAG: hypothetical protein ACLFNI_04170 [Natronomonas sp.]